MAELPCVHYRPTYQQHLPWAIEEVWGCAVEDELVETDDNCDHTCSHYKISEVDTKWEGKAESAENVLGQE